MKRLVLLFLSLILAVVGWELITPERPAKGQIVGSYTMAVCSSLAQLNTGSTGLTRIITGAAGKVIYICGWQITNTAASGTFQLAYGTGSNCATNTNATPALSVGSTPTTDHQQWAFFSVPATQPITGAQPDFCINPSVSTISGIIYFGQY